MKNKLTHFAIHTDDVDHAKEFYQQVFGWDFNDLGHADFLQIKANDGQTIGALQGRQYSPTSDKVIGFECTIEVTEIDNLAKTIVENGGQILMPKIAIPGVGWIIKFLDTEGNLTCAMEKDKNAK